jgi:hypothetical protein
LDKARDVLDRDRLSPKERKTYDYLQNIRSHELSMIASSKLEGREEGREEGRIEREKLAKNLEKLAKALEKEQNERAKEREEYEALLAELARLREAKGK